jgi:hypothetical protein
MSPIAWVEVRRAAVRLNRRTLLQALVKAGITPDQNSAQRIYFHLGQLPGQPHPAGLYLSPALPNECF